MLICDGGGGGDLKDVEVFQVYGFENCLTAVDGCPRELAIRCCRMAVENGFLTRSEVTNPIEQLDFLEVRLAAIFHRPPDPFLTPEHFSQNNHNRALWGGLGLVQS